MKVDLNQAVAVVLIQYVGDMTFVLLQASLFQCHISPYVDLMHTAFRRTGSHFGLIVNSLRFCAPPILRFRTNLKRRRVDWLVFPLLQALQNFLR